YVSADEELSDVLPTELVVDKLVKLPPKAKEIIKELENEYIYLEEGNAEATILADSEALVGIKARQICNGAVYKEQEYRKQADYTVLHDAKLDALDLLLDEIGGSPTLIIYEFRHDKQRIAHRHLNIPDVSDMTGECLRHLIKEFNAGNIPRMMIQSSKAKGLNIQGSCNHMIWFGLTWNWEHYKQMLDRLRRQGNPHKLVFVYRLIADAKWEKDVAKRLNEKRQYELSIKEDIRDARTDGAYKSLGVTSKRGILGVSPEE
ncbi:MAG: hypothetical protein LC687_07885, partial [Actinobacteria bacterium]|nr:hypothetical protein [Actinomycetota bacterium]